jgi:hypothetical protein
MALEDNGYRTYKELIQNRNQYAPLPAIIGIIAEFLSLGVQLPLLGRFFRRSFSLVSYALSYRRRKGDYRELYRLLTDCLAGTVFRNDLSHRWWYLMRFGVAVAQERQINWLIRDIVLEDNLILLGSLGPRPLKGYDVAYSFVGYSLWLFERGDVWGAINMVKLAEQADETWGYPEYLHGWYGLFTNGVDSVEHFARAVHIDWSFLQRMKQDKTCRQHPEVLHEVQKRTLVAK